MATITNPNLELKPDQSTKTVLATVTGKLNFTPYEMSQMQQGLRFRLKCELWGADSGFPDNGDDKLYSYSEIKTYPDSTPISSEPIKFEKTLGSSAVNEDNSSVPGLGGSRDEVYGKLILACPDDPSNSSRNFSVKTPEEHGHF